MVPVGSPRRPAAITAPAEAFRAADDALPRNELRSPAEVGAVATGDSGCWIGLAASARERLDQYLRDVEKYRHSSAAAGVQPDEEAINAGARRIIEQLAAAYADVPAPMRVEPGVPDAAGADGPGVDDEAKSPKAGADHAAPSNQDPPSAVPSGGNRLVDVGLGNPATPALGVTVGRNLPMAGRLPGSPVRSRSATPRGSAPLLFEPETGKLVDVGLGNPEVPSLGRAVGLNGPSKFMTNDAQPGSAGPPVVTPSASPLVPSAAPPPVPPPPRPTVPPTLDGAMAERDALSSEQSTWIIDDEDWVESAATVGGIGRPPPSRRRGVMGSHG
jgi:hypothetical protein